MRTREELLAELGLPDVDEAGWYRLTIGGFDGWSFRSAEQREDWINRLQVRSLADLVSARPAADPTLKAVAGGPGWETELGAIAADEWPAIDATPLSTLGGWRSEAFSIDVRERYPELAQVRIRIDWRTTS